MIPDVAEVKVSGGTIRITDADVVNPQEYGSIGFGAYNPHNVRPWLFHECGYTVAIVFADCEQDALDEAADSGKLDKFMVTPEEMKDYGEEEEGITRLGNASEPFDIESLSVVEMKLPEFSFVALYNASMRKQG